MDADKGLVQGRMSTAPALGDRSIRTYDLGGSAVQMMKYSSGQMGEGEGGTRSLDGMSFEVMHAVLSRECMLDLNSLMLG
jgi:hypothetical protein